MYVPKKIIKENKKIINVRGDGNCFYRVLALTLGMEENDYKEIKIIMYDFLEANKAVFDYLDSIGQLKKLIIKDREPAPFEAIYIATECF